MSGKIYLMTTLVLIVFGYSQAMDLKRMLEGQTRNLRLRRALPRTSHNDEVDTRGEATPCGAHNAGERWYEGCNTCGCPSARGRVRATPAICSQRDCRSPIHKRDLSQFDSENGERSEPSLMCAGGRMPGETYRKGCNRCHCSQGGMEYCTLKNCELGIGYESINSEGDATNEIIDVKAIQLTELLCHQQHLAGHKFTDGCHICYCSHHGLMCSTNYCPKLPASYWARKFRSDREREEANRERFDF